MPLTSKRTAAALAAVALLGAAAPACEGSEELPAPDQELDQQPGLEDEPREEQS